MMTNVERQCDASVRWLGWWRLWRGVAIVMRSGARGVVGVSGDLVGELHEVGIRRTALVHDGLDFPLVLPASEQQPSALVTIGRINAWKGQDILVDAVALLRRRGLEIPTVIAGGPFPGAEQHLTALQTRIAQHQVGDLVRLPGFVEDTATLLARAVVYAQPSRRPEPFGLALAEAMAARVA